MGKNIIMVIEFHKRLIPFSIFVLMFLPITNGQSLKLKLNGKVPFEQTLNSFPPKTFTKMASIPGLIDTAVPAIDQLESYYAGTYSPRYSWYKFEMIIPDSLRNSFAILKILKASYGTTIFINGLEAGNYMQCNTPIDCDLTPFIKWGETNELLVRLGDRKWLSKDAATGYDREKFSEIPGIWDDVFIEFSGPIKIHRLLTLPNCDSNTLKIKYQLENYANDVDRDMEYASINYTIDIHISDLEGNKITESIIYNGTSTCMQNSIDSVEFDISGLAFWQPESPNLYQVVATVTSYDFVFKNYGNKDAIASMKKPEWFGLKDVCVKKFGKRCFESQNGDFYLNGKRQHLYGSTITLNRFFEDKNRQNLPWDSTWVRQLLVNLPKSLGWNFFRVSLGLLPDFWYDIADENGILIQNEYAMWNLRGRESQYQKEYTDWIWSDGNHPSIVIWDALNEQKQEYIGRTLIPELKKLDPTRIWDLGYMKAEKGYALDMEEVHWYPLAHGWWVDNTWYKNHFSNIKLGSLSEKYEGLKDLYDATCPVIVNEFGWVWQSRDLMKSGIRTAGKFDYTNPYPKRRNYEYFERNGAQLYEDRDNFDHFLGNNPTSELREEFQAYVLAIESEVIRSCTKTDGMASFAYLSNDNGFTGDWFMNPISELRPHQSLLAQYHTCTPSAVFLDLNDTRYFDKAKFYLPKEKIKIDLMAINDLNEDVNGVVKVSLVDVYDKSMKVTEMNISLLPNEHKSVYFYLTLPSKAGGYMLLTEYTYSEKTRKQPQISRRYVRVGMNKDVNYPKFRFSNLGMKP